MVIDSIHRCQLSIAFCRIACTGCATGDERQYFELHPSTVRNESARAGRPRLPALRRQLFRRGPFHFLHLPAELFQLFRIKVLARQFQNTVRGFFFLNVVLNALH